MNSITSHHSHLDRDMPKQVASLSALLLLFGTAIAPKEGLCQHSVDVQRHLTKGEYLEALLEYDKMPRRKVDFEASFAAAKSAWALSIPDRAIEEFEASLRMPQLDPYRRAQVLLSRGILEYQEGRSEMASVYAQKVTEMDEVPPALRARAWHLWGEAMMRLGLHGAAEDKYIKALEEASEEDQGEFHFALGRCRLQMGRHEEAKKHFEAISPKAERYGEALRYLAEIALETRNFDAARDALVKGQEEFSNFFLDAWVDYALLQVAIAKRDVAGVEAVTLRANDRFPPSDPWLTLLNAAAEAFRWEHPREEFKKIEKASARK